MKKQEAYYEKHTGEIQSYKTAKQHFDNVMNGRKDLPIKEWQREQKQLVDKRYTLCEEYYSLKEKLPSAEAIRRSLENLMHEDMHKVYQTQEQGIVI